MELENSDQVVVNSEDHDDHGASTATGQLIVARSYECTFCKRGFSNAQALGGHMNIHRKDKAKLRQALDIPKMPPSYSPMIPVSSSSETTKPRRPPWFLDHQNTDGDEVHQLRLFAEAPPPDNYYKDHQKPDTPPPPPPPPPHHHHHHRHQVIDVKIEKGLSSSSTGSELDLELRLGPEPDQDAPAAIGTRKFFY